MSDRQRLQKALDDLEARGYETHARFWCCMSCGLAALREETTRYVFWHEQDDASAFGEAGEPFGYRNHATWGKEEPEDIWKNYNTLFHPLNLRWGGDASEIQAAFRKQGFTTEWEGSPNKTIEILPRPATLTKLRPA